MASIDQTIIQARVTLQDIEPPIWRRLLLPPALNLAELHHVLQAAFGWRDEHLHEFIIGGLVYGAPELAEETAAEDENNPRTFEATDVHLRDFDLYHVPDPRFLYHYDFGDSWLHLVEFERRIPMDIALKLYPFRSNLTGCDGGGVVSERRR
jgi:pRiA4b ORF-3-like protein